MTARYDGDRCRACRSSQVLPYAVLIGGTEEYGYQCLACEVMWPVLTYPATASTTSDEPRRSPAA